MKKKVLFVATVVKTHIMQFHIPYLKMFQDMGWETAVASRNDYEDPADCQIPYCDTFYDLPFERLPWKKRNLETYRRLKEILDREQFDIIHCHTPVGAMIARLAARSSRKRGTKVVYTAHGFHFYKGAPLINWLLYYPAEWLLAPLTDVLITINKEDDIRARKHLHAKRVEYVPGVGIRTEKFIGTPALRARKRQELGFGESDFVMLTVAEMTANKNHITVLNAMSKLKGTAEYEHFHYLICGRGAMWERLEQSAKELGISDHVHFLGYRKDAPELYCASDLFVFMTYREGLPVALMEAMCSGMCVACTQVRGNTDLIENGVSGQFVPNDPQALAQTISQLYHDPEKRRRYGTAAAAAAKQYDESIVHNKVKDIYLSL